MKKMSVLKKVLPFMVLAVMFVFFADLTVIEPVEIQPMASLCWFLGFICN